MSRQSPLLGVVTAAALMVFTGLIGCQPQQPFFFHEDGDLSHYLGVATDIDYPDVDEYTLSDAEGAIRPFSLENSNPCEIWDLTLEEAVHLALANGKVMRTIGGQIQGPPESLTRVPEQVPTIYDPALIESNPRFGTEAALSAFDSQLTTSVFWEKNDSPRNPLVFPGSEDVFPRIAKEDVGSFQAQLRKTNATGGTWLLTHNVAYSKQNTSRLFTSDWNVNLEAEFRQPLFQGAGVQYNRIAGPGAIPGFNNGVMIARINTDIALADFEDGVQTLVSDVEIAYWELYFAYRNLDAVIAGRDSGLQTWRQIKVRYDVGSASAQEEAQARQQYFLFKRVMEGSLSDLYAAESKFRYMLGLAATDGRLIRPADEPPTARLSFDWHESLCESLARNVSLRRQKWNIKRRELELISAKNYLLPRLDAVGRYRFLGLGDDLINLNNGSGDAFNNAYGSMMDGNFQEWHLGVDLTIPIGFRKEMSGVRNAQLNVARERARLQDQELEVSHQLAHAVREVEKGLKLAHTNFDRRIAALAEVKAAEAEYDAGTGTLDRVLDAQRRQAEADSDYYRSLVDYVKSISQVHLRKGSLLEYNGVYLAEGPWPAKAYFDAHRRARARDASFYLDYGFTLPKVISRGAYQQHVREGGLTVPFDEGVEMDGYGQGMPELVPTPAPIPPGEEAEAVEPPAKRSSSPQPPARPLAAGTSGRTPQLAKAAGNRSTVAAGSTAVKTADYRQSSGRVAQAKRIEVNRAKNQWKPSHGAGTRYESGANPPAAGNNQPASGWKQVQR